MDRFKHSLNITEEKASELEHMMRSFYKMKLREKKNFKQMERKSVISGRANM